MARIAAGANGTIKDALLAAGYSPQSAARGVAALPAGEREKFKQARQDYRLKKLGKYEDLGKKVTAEQQQDMVRGLLLDNLDSKKDRAKQSAKLLGQDKRVAMWEPENASGVLIINAAPIPSFEGIPHLDAEGNHVESPCSLSSGKPPELVGRRGGGCGWDSNYKAPEAPEMPKDKS